MQKSYAVFPKKGKIYQNLQPLFVNSIAEISNLKNAIGYISYENYHHIEEIPLPKNSTFCNLPKIHFSQFYEEKTFKGSSFSKKNLPEISWVKSNMTKAEYCQKVEKIIEYIKKGTCYQVNLTRKFFGEFTEKPNPFDVFSKLYSISPNPSSMLYVLDENRAIVSSSPECFLTRKENVIYSCPIKGSLGSGSDISELHNAKDLSENLMITDLVRNDLSKISNKVWVENLQKTETFSQIHHMSSKVYGNLLPNTTNGDCINATFPAGSMTGTPKIKAIEIANELENQQRGIYSGCLGIVDDFQNFDFSVVIRTIILDGKKFEFQVGGAIVYDSTPQGEFEETITKALPILETLGLTRSIF
jgi:anthranilate/para-aminobenzoate synthase component I